MMEYLQIIITEATKLFEVLLPFIIPIFGMLFIANFVIRILQWAVRL